jgi:hypothetical protein
MWYLLKFYCFLVHHAVVGRLNDHCLFSMQRCTSFCRDASSAWHDADCRGSRALCNFGLRRWRSFLPSPSCLLGYLAYHNTLQQHITGRYRVTWVAAVEEQRTLRLYTRNFVSHVCYLAVTLSAVSTRTCWRSLTEGARLGKCWLIQKESQVITEGSSVLVPNVSWA